MKLQYKINQAMIIVVCDSLKRYQYLLAQVLTTKAQGLKQHRFISHSSRFWKLQEQGAS